jgi:hypothetical protein
MADGHLLHANSKAVEILTFSRAQRMLPEKWDNDLKQVRTPCDVVRVEVFSVVVVAGIRVNRTDAEKGV